VSATPAEYRCPQSARPRFGKHTRKPDLSLIFAQIEQNIGKRGPLSRASRTQEPLSGTSGLEVALKPAFSRRRSCANDGVRVLGISVMLWLGSFWKNTSPSILIKKSLPLKRTEVTGQVM
jgi:hypothetical protein